MTQKYLFPISIILTFSAISCKIKNADKKYFEGETNEFAVTEIRYYPSFTNACILTIDTTSNIFALNVDTSLKYNFGNPEKASISFSKSDRETTFSNYWNRDLLRMIKSNRTKPVLTDGTNICIYYSMHNGIKDSIFTGNNYSDSLREILKAPIRHIENNAKDIALKKYLWLLLDQI